MKKGIGAVRGKFCQSTLTASQLMLHQQVEITYDFNVSKT
jgi:hypothetical protein